MSKVANKLERVISFGGVDAKNDDLLLSAFEDHEAYKAALSFSKFLIIGRKGSGKSAIFKKITCDNRMNVIADGYAFSDYPWEYHERQKQSGVPEEECYRESWKYFINLMICRSILNSRGDAYLEGDAKGAFSEIERFVEDTYGSKKPSLNQVFTPGIKIRLSGALELAGIKLGLKVIDIANLPKYYSEINRNIFECILRYFSSIDKYIYLCFDELDIGFDPINTDYRNRLVGLIRAAKFSNDQFRSKRVKGAVILLLRDDIWHTLRFEDKNKYTQEHVSEIFWSKEDGPHCIKRLMERRFREVLGPGASWNLVFNESRSMARFQSKYDYICERGFLRPRDVIQYCNEVLKQYRHEKNIHGLDNEGFDNELVRKAEEAYSRYFMLELEDELHKHSQSYERYFEVLKDLSNVVFSREDFCQAWNERRSLFDNGETPERALESLFEFSIIGFLATGGRCAGSKYVWHYLEPRVRFNRDAKTYQVHMGLRSEFDLKLYARRRR